MLDPWSDEGSDLPKRAIQDDYDEFRFLPLCTEFHAVLDKEKRIVRNILHHHHWDINSIEDLDPLYKRIGDYTDEKIIRTIIIREHEETEGDTSHIMVKIWDRLWMNYNRLIDEVEEILGPMHFEGGGLEPDPWEIEEDEILREAEREAKEKAKAKKDKEGEDTIEVSEKAKEGPLAKGPIG